MNPPQLLFKPAKLSPTEGGVLVETDPASAGWEYLSFSVRHIPEGMSWSGKTGSQEAALVVLGGTLGLSAGGHNWELGERPGPFGGLPWSAYLPPRTEFIVRATGPVDLAIAMAPAEGRHPAALVAP